jgi:hypothetical protein
MSNTKGRRVKDWDGSSILENGDYAKNPRDGNWYAMTPNGRLGNLASHDVTEHEDGTITVRPSILVTTGSYSRPAWHGYLKCGVWTEC